MSDKKEIAALSIKISVDSTDLDKLEAQLKRIAGLMVDVGLKQPTSVGFSADMFLVKNGQVFIDETFIDKAAIQKIAIQSPTTTIRTGVRYDDKQQSARAQLETSDAANVLEQLNESFYKSANGGAMAQTIRIDTAVDNDGLEEFKRQVESEFSYLQSSIAAIRHTQASSDMAITSAVEQIRADIRNGSVSL